ncbi:MAG TPA: UbiD family decarboxylase [candidate division Zixibacteria bacterium]|nr:UbiD family decarboxylase [candidate division Zixibacteria bacterium]
MSGRRYYRDFRDHLRALEERDKLVRIHREIDKDTELMPLVRWQFRGLEEADRKAFLFEKVVDAKGRRFSMPVSVGTLAATTEIYGIGMMCRPEEIHERWTRAQMNPIDPVRVASGPAQEVVRQGAELSSGYGLDMLPVPISTPGFDNAPYLTSANWITKDPETGIYNIGNYRGQIKAPDRVGGLFTSQHMGQHWRKCKAMGKRLEAAIAIGVIPSIAYAATAKIPYDFDEYRLAGGLAGEPVEVVRCKTIDLEVPATAEIVIEGTIPTDSLEPEGPFGEYPGYMGHRTISPYLEVTCITHRRDAIYTALMSQFPPSESSKIKHTGTEKILYKFLRHDSGNAAVLDVALHDEVSGSGQAYCVIKMRNATKADAWRALNASAGFTGSYAKICVAVDEDIDIRDPAMVNWAICFNVRPEEDVAVVRGKSPGLDPSAHPPGRESLEARMASTGALLINAVRPWPYTPVSLPKREYMEKAKALWEELGLPPLKPRMPWYGYSLGAWTREDEEEADLAVRGECFRTGEKQARQRQKI